MTDICDIPISTLVVPEVSFVLPEPPSTNALFRNVTVLERDHARRTGRPLPRGRAKTRTYKSWLLAAGWEMRTQRHPLPYFPGKIGVRIGLSDKTRLDVDNLKAIGDLLTAMGIIEDDSRIDDYSVAKLDGVPKGRLSLTVRRM